MVSVSNEKRMRIMGEKGGQDRWWGRMGKNNVLGGIVPARTGSRHIIICLFIAFIFHLLLQVTQDGIHGPPHFILTTATL